MAAYSTALIALEGRRFRNIVICASAIPNKVDSIQTGVPHRVANSEFILWSQIVGNRSTRATKFSDYGARYAHQKDGGGGSRPPARIHLTTTERHHLYLGEPQRYRELCSAAIQNEEFSQQSWGTRAVRDCGAVTEITAAQRSGLSAIHICILKRSRMRFVAASANLGSLTSLSSRSQNKYLKSSRTCYHLCDNAPRHLNPLLTRQGPTI